MFLYAVASVAALLLAFVLYVALNPVRRWRYRHIPGPRFRPFVGNIPEFATIGSHEFMERCSKKYGKVFKLWFGLEPLVVVADAELGRRVNYRFLNRPRSLQNPIARGPVRLEENKGLFFARDEVWRVLHKAWQPAFYPDSVTGYSPLMTACARELNSRLEGFAVNGEPLNFSKEVGSLTMAVVGRSAFGIDFQTINESADENQFASEVGVAGRTLVQAAQTIFSAASASQMSVYAVLARVLPDFTHPLVALLAAVLPDHRAKELQQAQDDVFGAMSRLIQEEKKAEQQQSLEAAAAAAADKAGGDKPGGPLPTATILAVASEGSTPTNTPPATPPATPSSSLTAAAGKAASGWGHRRGPIAPGSFLGLLLSTRNSITGHSLTDFSMMMQATTFMLAGYETTANCIAYCMYCLATHPEVEERLREELRAGLAEGPVVAQEVEKKFPYLCAVINESLRLFPPGSTTVRQSKEETLEVGGYSIPPQTTLHVASYVIHRDLTHWPRPEEFLPERWLPGNEHMRSTNPAAFLPFGSGPRMCVGYRFALQEVQLTLLELYRRYSFKVHWPSMTPPHPDSLAAAAAARQGGRQPPQGLRLINGITLSPVDGIWVTVQQVEEL